MSKPSSNRDTLSSYLRDLDTRTSRQERHTHHGVGALEGGTAMFISADRGNDSMLGYDAGLYTREVFAKASTPTATDFGGHLRPGCVWVEIGGGPDTCLQFSDDFERADGPLGANWITASAGPSTGIPEPLVIASGAAIDATASGTSFGDADPSASFWAAPFPDDHFIELDVESMGGGNNYLFIYVRFDPVTWTGVSYNFVTTTSSPWQHGNFRRITYTNGAAGGAIVVGEAEPLTTLRLESSGGTSRLYANGSLVDEYPDTDYASGEFVGFGAGRSSHATATASPRIAAVTGGCLEAPTVALAAAGDVCDDFERADGPVGPDWILAPSGWGTPPERGPMFIEDGAAVGVHTVDVAYGGMARETDVGTQWIEVDVERAFDSSAPNAAYVALLTNMTVGSLAAQAADFNFAATDNIDITLFQFDASGGWVSTLPGTIHWPHVGEVEPVTLRFESDPDGTQRVYVDGELVVEWVDPTPVSGTFVGAQSFVQTDLASIRILRACVSAPTTGTGVGTLSAWTGTAWVEGPAYGWDGSAWVPATAVHCWSGTGWVTAAT